MPIKYSREDILRQFKEAHGDKYDYSKFIYVKDAEPVIIICPIHGEFKQIPKTHKTGIGCLKCGTERMRLNCTIDLTDQKFGKLKVIRRISIEERKALGIKHPSVHWEVQCACGRDPFIISGSDLRRKNRVGRYKPAPQRWSCRVCTDRATSLRQRKESFAKIENKKFSLLTVLREWGSDKGSRMRVLCLCDCGRTTITQAEHLKSGHTKSCGCLDSGEDSYPYFKEHPEYADSDCFFYIAKLDEDYLKVGITNDLKERKRKSGGNYEKYLFKQKLNRSESWTIEQIILYESLDAKPLNTPTKFKDMKGGQQEIRIKNQYGLNFYRNKYFELLEKMTEYGGWEELYLSRFKY
jgi:hypothetical protein